MKDSPASRFSCFKERKNDVIAVAISLLILDGLLLCLLRTPYFANQENSVMYHLFLVHRIASLLSSIMLLIAAERSNIFLMVPWLVIQGITLIMLFVLSLLAIGLLGFIGVLEMNEKTSESRKFLKKLYAIINAADRDEAVTVTLVFLGLAVIWFPMVLIFYGIVKEYYRSLKERSDAARHDLNETTLLNYSIINAA